MTEPSVSSTQVLAKPAFSISRTASRTPFGAGPRETAEPFLANITGTTLSETDTMSSTSAPLAKPWYGASTASAQVLKASITSSASRIQVMNHTSLPRTLIPFRTDSLNDEEHRLSQSATTTGSLPPVRGRPDTASAYGTVTEPGPGSGEPPAADTHPSAPSPTSLANRAGISMPVPSRIRI